MIAGLLVVLCSGSARAQKILFDFEGNGGLGGIKSAFGATLEQSRDHVTRGKRSLKMPLLRMAPLAPLNCRWKT